MGENRRQESLLILCEAAKCFKSSDDNQLKNSPIPLGTTKPSESIEFEQHQISTLKSIYSRAKTVVDQFPAPLGSEETVEVLQAAHEFIQILRKTKNDKEFELKALDHQNEQKLQQIKGLRTELSSTKLDNRPNGKIMSRHNQPTTHRQRTMTEPSQRPPIIKSARKRNNKELMRHRALSISFDPINLSQQVRRHHEEVNRLPSINGWKKAKIEIKSTAAVQNGNSDKKPSIKNTDGDCTSEAQFTNAIKLSHKSS